VGENTRAQEFVTSPLVMTRTVKSFGQNAIEDQSLTTPTPFIEKKDLTVGHPDLTEELSKVFAKPVELSDPRHRRVWHP
jgi:uncharacterized SAM-binding protein YcdF (DUF218 family)